MVIFKHRGSFKNTENFLSKAQKAEHFRVLDKYAKEGVSALMGATPVDTGKTANSWDYEINVSNGSYSISWTNSNVIDGVPIAIILQYGHATRNGGYVQGRDYINEALKPIFDRIANEVWREVINL